MLNFKQAGTLDVQDVFPSSSNSLDLLIFKACNAALMLMWAHLLLSDDYPTASKILKSVLDKVTPSPFFILVSHTMCSMKPQP